MRPNRRASKPALSRAGSSGGHGPRLDIVIFARDEAEVLGRALRALRAQLGPNDRLHVVADHCRDLTAQVAAAHDNVELHERSRGRPGKGRALRWWLAREPGRADPGGYVIVMDADSLPRPDWLPALRGVLAQDSPAAVQSQVEPWLTRPHPVATLAGLSEQVEQRIYDRLRAALGWPVRLRGTGMAIRRDLLQQVAGRLCTEIEDAELSLLLTARGQRARPAPSARVLDPKPKDTSSAQRQRARWFKGQLNLLRRHPAALAHALRRGPGAWSALASLLLKPRSLWLALQLTLAAGLLLSGGIASIGGGILAAAALAEALLALGLALTLPDRARYLKASLHLPAYGLMWLRSVALALVSKDPWLRARRPKLEPKLNEVETARS